MPYTIQNPPDAIKKLPAHAIEIWVSAYNSALDQYKDEGKANAVAWAAVKNKYEKVKDKWVAKKATEINMNKKISKFIYPIRIEDLVFAEGKDTMEIQVLELGSWKHPIYGKIKISEKEIGEFIDNFNDDVRRDLPITEGHSVGKELPAIGWFKELLNKGRDGLWAVVEWTKQGRKLLEEKSYKYFSPEYYTAYDDPETHKVYNNVLVGGALTNSPYFKGLKAIVLSEQTLLKDMNLEEILKKEASELTDEETKFVKENESELSDDDKEKFKDALAEGVEEGDDDEKAKAEAKEKEETEAKEKAEAEAKEKEEAEEKEKEKQEGSDKIIQMSEKVVRVLESNAKEGVKAMAILRRKEVESIVDKFTFNESKESGLILPKSRGKVVDFLLSLSEKQRNEFQEILNDFPKGKLFSELGKDSGVAVKASEKAQLLVDEKMSKDKELTYSQALGQVFSENPDLAKQVEQE